jgi:putative transposase
MAIPIRNSQAANVIAGARTFFVTSSTWGRRRLLQTDRSAQLFIKTIYDYRAQGKFRLHDFVVMPDHFHVLLTVESNMTIERAVQFIKGGFAFRAGKELGIPAPIWQKGFSEIRVVDALAFACQRDYILQNPVRANLVATAEEYSYSSAHRAFELDPPPQRLKPIVEEDVCGTAEAIP